MFVIIITIIIIIIIDIQIYGCNEMKPHFLFAETWYYYYYYFAFLLSTKFSTQPYKQHLHLHPATRLLPVYSGLVRSLL